MSLMRNLMAKRFGSSPAKKSSLEFKAKPVHPGKADLHDPKPSPLPRAPRVERRARIDEGHADGAPELPVEEPIRGEPLPPPPPVAAPLERAVELAAAAAPERKAAAAALEAQRTELEAKARWKSPCKAVDAGTGLPCGLLHGHTVAHRHARGEFVRVATGPVRREVDGAAWASTR